MNQIIQGDCLSILRTIADDSVDLVLTSPPYNKNGWRGKRDSSKGKGRWTGADITYDDYLDDKSEGEYRAWQVDILNECYRIIKPTGSILYNHKIRRGGGLASHPYQWILQSQAKFYQEIIWNRLGGCDHNINYLDPITERVYWLIKGKPKCYKNERWATEIWSIPPEVNTLHPAPFPLLLCKVAVMLTTDEGDIVVDPFFGSGTVGVASIELKRQYIGIEINPKYIEMAQKRIKKVEAQLTLL